jgi:hypothetical protein
MGINRCIVYLQQTPRDSASGNAGSDTGRIKTQFLSIDNKYTFIIISTVTTIQNGDI